MASLSGKVALVTGASSGIGWELVRQLAAEGCKVGLVARREAPLRELESLIAARGGTPAVAVADVGNREQVETAFSQVCSRLGRVALVVANAGVGKPTMLDPVNMADIEEMVRINLMGVIYTISAALPEMLAQERSLGRDIEPRGPSRIAGRVGVLREQSRGEHLHGRFAHSPARNWSENYHRLPGFRQDTDDRHHGPGSHAGSDGRELGREAHYSRDQGGHEGL